MEKIGRRGLLQLMLGVGAAAALGLRATDAAAEKSATATESAGAIAAEAATDTTEAVEAGLEPNQFFVVRRRRYRRRVYFIRPRRRRRVYFIRRRPRRYRIVRVYRRRRW